MKATPAASLEMTETNLLFELLIIALDAPAQLGELDQTGQRHVRKCREPVLGRHSSDAQCGVVMKATSPASSK